ncbi:MAG: hypothetical protein IMZ44_21310 [Planctomycetes bacterium]|nr:hypothetical protein [Planctomycetota bacterium]
MSIGDIRRRGIQEMILRDLYIRFEAMPGVPLLWHSLLYGFQNSTVPYTEDEIRASLADLCERGLALSEQTPGVSELPECGYRITPDGCDFYVARCPWNLVNRFAQPRKP